MVFLAMETLRLSFPRLAGASVAACALARSLHRDAAAEPASASSGSSLLGKKAIVFGGTSGIGLATSLLLRAEGAEVCAVSRDPSKAGQEVQEKLALRACDVRSRSACKAVC